MIKYMLIPVYYNTDETRVKQDAGIDHTITEKDFEIRHVAFQADKLHPLQPEDDFFGVKATKIGSNGEWFTTPIELEYLIHAIGEVLAMPVCEGIANPFKINLN